MCSVGDDLDENGKLQKIMQEKPVFNIQENKCLKCRSIVPVVVLQSKYSYCKECFIAGTLHKFKALLGKNRVIHVDDKVLIWHRTGHPTSALLHFLRSGLDLKTPKRIKFSPVVLFIEDHYDIPLNERQRILKKIDEEVKGFGFPVYYISLLEYLSQKQIDLVLQEEYEKIGVSENDLAETKKFFKKKPTKTVEKEMRKIIQHEILTNVAKHLRCSSVFIPDLAMDVASQFLTNITLGRGAQTVYDIGIVDDRDELVKILRPLRSFTIKELAYYNHFFKLEPVTYILPEENSYCSFQTLMDKFISDLQINYPATISTVVRTSDKLSIDKAEEYFEKCLLCKVPIEHNNKGLESTEATNFSRWISNQDTNCDVSIDARSKQLFEDFNNTSDKQYCFSCRSISEYLL